MGKELPKYRELLIVWSVRGELLGRLAENGKHGTSLKSCPSCETQCASSRTMRAIITPFSLGYCVRYKTNAPRTPALDSFCNAAVKVLLLTIFSGYVVQ